jgi:hypothetical protein
MDILRHALFPGFVLLLAVVERQAGRLQMASAAQSRALIAAVLRLTQHARLDSSNLLRFRRGTSQDFGRPGIPGGFFFWNARIHNSAALLRNVFVLGPRERKLSTSPMLTVKNFDAFGASQIRHVSGCPTNKQKLLP